MSLATTLNYTNNLYGQFGAAPVEQPKTSTTAGKILGGIVGAVGGFCVGGPVGAVVGAGVGAAAGTGVQKTFSSQLGGTIGAFHTLPFIVLVLSLQTFPNVNSSMLFIC